MPPSPGRQASVRLLLVNDDVSVTDACSRALRLQGFEVWAALSGTEGLTLARKHLPHAILMDLRMPLTAVLSLVRSVRMVPGLADVPVAVVTWNRDLDDPLRAETERLGVELQFKPVWLGELVTLARSLPAAPVH